MHIFVLIFEHPVLVFPDDRAILSRYSSHIGEMKTNTMQFVHPSPIRMPVFSQKKASMKGHK